MRDGHHRRRGKAFEEPELVQAAVNLWLNEMRFESHAQAATVLGGVHRSAVWRWRNRKSRPDTTTLRRMIRLLLWQAEGWRGGLVSVSRLGGPVRRVRRGARAP